MPALDSMAAMIEKAMLVLAESVIMLVRRRGEGGPHLEEGRIAGSPVIQDLRRIGVIREADQDGIVVQVSQTVWVIRPLSGPAGE